MKTMLKKITCTMLTLSMAITMLPAQVFAAEPDDGIVPDFEISVGAIEEREDVEAERLVSESETSDGFDVISLSAEADDSNGDAIDDVSSHFDADEDYSEENVILLGTDEVNLMAVSADSITNAQVFLTYPQYLNSKEADEITDRSMDLCFEIIGSNSNNTLQVAMTAWKSGIKIGVSDISARLGWGDTYEESILRSATEKFLATMPDSVEIPTGSFDKIRKAFGTLDDSASALTKGSAIEVITQMLVESGKPVILAQNMAKDYCDKITQPLDSVAYTLNLWNTAVGIFTLYMYDYYQVVDLMDCVDPNSDLYRGLDLVKQSMDNPISYIFADFIKPLVVKEVASKISREVTTFIANVAGASAFQVALYKLAKSLFFDYVYDSYTIDQYAEAVYLMSFSQTLDLEVSERKSAFINGTASTNDISSFRELYEIWIVAQRAALHGTSDLLSVTNNYNLKTDALCHESYLEQVYGFDLYMTYCKKAITADINGGYLDNDGAYTPVDSETNSSSIISRMNAVQEKFKPNSGVQYTGTFQYSSGAQGFAKNVFYLLYGESMPSVSTDNRAYVMSSTSVQKVGQLNAVDNEVTEIRVRQLLSQAKMGDVLLAYGEQGAHMMIVYSVSDNSAIVYDCNSPYNGAAAAENLIQQYEFIYADMAAAFSKSDNQMTQIYRRREGGMALYHARKYERVNTTGADITYDDSVNYIISGGTLTGYVGSRSTLEIPDGVTAIADGCFMDKTSIRYVYMPDTVTYIGPEAFSGCTNLVYVQMPSKLETLGESAFDNCQSLSGIIIKGTITVINENTFYNCRCMSSIILPDTITEIMTGAFTDCTALKSVKLPESLETLGYISFQNCTALENLYIPASLTNVHTDFSWWSGTYGPFAYCSSLDNITFGEGFAAIPNNLFTCCTGLTRIEIPEGVAEIGESAFSECENLSSVVISDTVTNIRASAFSDCTSLVEVRFGEGVTDIQSSAFYGCTALRTLSLPESLTTLGYVAFEYCTALESVYIPASLNEVHTDFSWWSGTYGPFAYCNSLNSVTIGEGFVAIPDYLFTCCTGLTYIKIPEGVTEIGTAAFSECENLASVEIPNTVTKIGDGAFYKTGLTSIAIPDSVIVYEGALFQDCTDLCNVTLSENALVIPEYMFYGCPSLETVKMPDGVTEIKNNTFYGCAALTDLSFIPYTLVSIEDSAFQNCTSLTNADLPDLVSSLGSRAFRNCTCLTSFTAGNDLLEIGWYCFQDCTALKNIDLNNGLTTIGGYAFQNCAELETIMLPDSVTSLGQYAFQKDPKLVNVTLSKGLKEIPTYAFANCTSMVELVIPNGVTSIAANAFYQNTKLKTFTIPASVTSIGSNAFSYPTTTTVYGIEGSYAQSFARWQSFVDITNVATGVTLLNGKTSITVPAYETLHIPFVFAPADTTDFIQSYASTNEDAVYYDEWSGTLRSGWGGTSTVTVTTYGGLTCTFTVTVDTLTCIEITHLPNTTDYGLKDDKNITGLVVSAVFSNGSKESIYDYTLNGFTTDTLGTHTVTATYNGQTTTFPITVSMVKSGKLGNSGELSWTYSSGLGQVTITGPVSASEPVYVAVYEKSGKMTAVTAITASGGKANVGNSFDCVKLFWIDANSAPKCANAVISTTN